MSDDKFPLCKAAGLDIEFWTDYGGQARQTINAADVEKMLEQTPVIKVFYAGDQLYHAPDFVDKATHTARLVCIEKKSANATEWDRYIDVVNSFLAAKLEQRDITIQTLKTANLIMADELMKLRKKSKKSYLREALAKVSKEFEDMSDDEFHDFISGFVSRKNN
jgi:hypothetical protein